MGPISRILIYPIKSLDGVEVPEVATLASGALAGDRRLALVDANGRVMNGKRDLFTNKKIVFHVICLRHIDLS